MSLNRLIGYKIQMVREEKGISQEQLARVLGCSQSALSNYENGKRRLYLSQLEKLSEILEKPLEFFVDIPMSANFSPAIGTSNQPVFDLITSIYHLNQEQLDSVSEYIAYLKWKRSTEEY